MSKEEKPKIIPLEEVLVRFNKHNKEFKDNLEKEEGNERIESLDAIQNDIKAAKHHTTLKKNQFITELKTGLGEKVKKNPTTIKSIRVEKKWYQKLGATIKRLFTKF